MWHLLANGSYNNTCVLIFRSIVIIIVKTIRKLCAKSFVEVVYNHSIYEMMLWGVLAIIAWTCISHLAMKTEQGFKLWMLFNRCLAVLMMVFIISQTILFRPVRERSVSLIPFFSFTFQKGSFRYNTVIANMLLFIPLGLTLPFGLKRKPVLTTVLFAFAISVLIELIQFVFKLGLCETDDVIFNTFGAALGASSYAFVSRVGRR